MQQRRHPVASALLHHWLNAALSAETTVFYKNVWFLQLLNNEEDLPVASTMSIPNVSMHDMMDVLHE